MSGSAGPFEIIPPAAEYIHSYLLSHNSYLLQSLLSHNSYLNSALPLCFVFLPPRRNAPFRAVGADLRVGPLTDEGAASFQRRRGGNLPPGEPVRGRGRTHRSASTGSCLPFRFVLLPPGREVGVFGGESGQNR